MSKTTISLVQDGSSYKVLRGKEHIANYDPTSEETTFTENKFKQHKNAVNTAIEAEFAEVDVAALESEITELKAENTKLKADVAAKADDNSAEEIKELKIENAALGKQVENLQEEIDDLESEKEDMASELVKAQAIAKSQEGAEPIGDFPQAVDTKPSNDPRYADNVDETGAPAQDPMLGDLTPAYIEWARKNMPPAIFKKRYNRRIPNV